MLKLGLLILFASLQDPSAPHVTAGGAAAAETESPETNATAARTDRRSDRTAARKGEETQTPSNDLIYISSSLSNTSSPLSSLTAALTDTSTPFSVVFFQFCV